jgi:hypothetical protein
MLDIIEDCAIGGKDNTCPYESESDILTALAIATQVCPPPSKFTYAYGIN